MRLKYTYVKVESSAHEGMGIYRNSSIIVIDWPSGLGNVQSYIDDSIYETGRIFFKHFLLNMSQ